MKKIEFNGHKVSIPTNWSEITLGDYEKWYANKAHDEVSQTHYLADLCKMDVDRLRDAPKDIFKEITDTLQFTFDTDFEPSQNIRINLKMYTIAESDELTLGEWVDTESLFNVENKSLLSDLLAVLCRPVGKVYDHKETAKRAKLFRAQSCEKMLPLVSFFLFRKQKLEETLSHSLQVVEAVSQYLQDTKTFATSGDGIKQLPIWQRIRYAYLTKSLEKQLSRFSAFYSTKEIKDMPKTTK